jgi:uncharacterized protein (TIGR03437 family)
LRTHCSRSQCAAAILIVLAAPAISFGQGYPYVLRQFAGNSNLGDGGAALSALLQSPTLAASDPAGDIFIYDNGHFREITPDGTIHPAASLPRNTVSDFKIAKDGTFYFTTSQQVLKMTPGGSITVIAGALSPPYTGDGAPAVTAQLLSISGVAVDSAGSVYFSENDSRVREVTPDGIIHTFAGSSTRGYSGDSGPATSALLNIPLNLAFDSSNNLYILDRSNFRIRKVTPQGIITTFAGNGSGGLPKNGPATSSPLGFGALFGGLAIDSSNNVYVGDEGNGAVDEIAQNGTLTQIAGIPQSRFGPYANGLATGMSLNNIQYVAIGPAGDLIVSDTGTGRIVEIESNGQARTVAGESHFAGDGGPATSALLNVPSGALADNKGNVFIADWNNFRIRRVTPDGKIDTVIGTGAPGVPGINAAALQSQVQNVSAMAVDSQGNLYFESDPGLPGPGQLFELTSSNTVQGLAGKTGFGADSGIGGPATQALLSVIVGLTIDPSGNIYVADESGNMVYKISMASGIISAFAGGGQIGTIPVNFNGPATSLALNLRGGGILASDALGNIYISDYGGTSVLSVSPAGIATVAAQEGFGEGITVDNAGNVYWVVGNQIFRLSGGVAQRIAGNGTAPATDGAFATSVSFSEGQSGFEFIGGVGGPSYVVGALGGLSVDANGDLYVPETGSSIVWKLVLDSPSGLTTSGDKQTGQVGWTLPNPLQVVVNGRAGVPVPGVAVNFAVTSGSAALSAASVVTDASGTASVQLTLGATPGSVVVTASAAGLAPVQFNATTIAAPSGGGTTCTISALPSITSVNSATDFGGLSNFAPGSWLEVKGSNLAVDTRLWAGSDFQGSNAPTGLDTSSVSIDGNAGFVYYISGGQINVQAPADSATGPVKIAVTTCAGTSASFTTQEASLAPGMLAPASFNIGGKQYLVALFQDGVTYVGNSGLIPGIPFQPAKPGDSITAYGIGFGAVTPIIAPGVVVGQQNSIPNLTISFGAIAGSTTPAALTYAGLAPGNIGLYQFNITVPQVANGDYQINVSVGGVQVAQTLYLTVQQ